MALVAKNFSDIITFTRASTATYFNSAGVLTSAAINEARFDFNPATLAARGLLIEEARTNSIRNNTMQGAVAGTPGTLPQVSGSASWSASLAGGLSREVVSVSSINGINYIDIRIFGTTTNTNLALNLYFELATQIAALTGQTWSESVWVQMVGGSTAGIGQIYLAMVEISSGGADLAYLSGTTFLPTIGTFTRRTYTATTSNASTAFIRPALWVSSTGIGAVIDITLRIGLPQLELGAFATSVIPTTVAAATRNADQASVNTLSPWFNATEGTLYGEITDAAITVSGVSRRIANINDGTEADRITVGWAGATSVAAAFVTDNSVTQASFTSPSGAYPFPTKVALAYKAADFQAAVNGSAFATVSSGTVPTVNRMTIGDVVTGSNGTQNINGHIRRITYYPRRLSQAELTAITA